MQYVSKWSNFSVILSVRSTQVEDTFIPHAIFTFARNQSTVTYAKCLMAVSLPVSLAYSWASECPDVKNYKWPA